MSREIIKKRTLSFKLILSILCIIACFSFSGCDFIQNLMNEPAKTEDDVTITQSGLAENKYIITQIDNSDYEITLFAKTGKLFAEKSSRAIRTAVSSASLDGQFVYNSNTKTVFMCLKGTTTKYKKADVNLAGKKGSDSSKPVSVSLTSSTKNEFLYAIETVETLPVETTVEENNETDNPGNNDTPDNNDTPENNDNPDNNDNPGNQTTPDNPNGNTATEERLQQGKKWSDYEGGMRTISFGERTNNTDSIFVSTIQPLPRPDYSEIDKAAKALSIPTTTSIEDAAKLIVQTTKASTVKEKARAIFIWVAYYVDYDYSHSRNSAEEAFKDRLAVCDGYSKLVEKMCKAVDVDCVEYAGYVTNGIGEEKFNPSIHAWNRICLDKNKQQYFVLDATYASGGSIKNNNKTVADSWFDPDPCYFATSHYSDELGTLVSPKISRDDFVSLPVLQPKLEEYGIDGKELLEFCYSHKIYSTISNIFYLHSGTKIIKMPITDTLLHDKTYVIAYEYDGKYYEEKFTTDKTGDSYTVQLGSAGFLSYALAEEITLPEEMDEFKEPDPVFYDDNIKINLNDDNPYLTKKDGIYNVGNWQVTCNEQKVLHFWAEGVSRHAFYLSAQYDALYQEWNFINGHYRPDNFQTPSSDTKKFDENLEDILNKLITIDKSIPLDRKGYYETWEYNVVHVPLSKKNEVMDSVTNYDWQKDTEFAEFVNWMVKHNIPQKDIDFYKEMARYPYQRGAIVSNTEPNRHKLAGIDCTSYPYARPLVDEQGNEYYAGGMQKYFEYRKQETRHLFRNETIPILLVHIKDTEGAADSTVPEGFFDDEAKSIKQKFATAGFTNTFDIDFVEITMSYKEFDEKCVKKDPWGNLYEGKWASCEYGTDEVLAEIAKTNPTLAQKYSDKVKTAVIKYFDTTKLNGRVGNINGECLVRSRFDNIMANIGYSRFDHMNIFGTLRKTKSPSCFDNNCLREDAICPLCLYSLDID